MSCKGCTERRVGCHATCEEYLNWKKERDARRADINKKRQDAALWQDYKQRSIRAAKLEYSRRQSQKHRDKTK